MRTLLFLFFALGASGQVMNIQLLPEDTTNEIPAYLKVSFTQPANQIARLMASNKPDFTGNVQLVAAWGCPNPSDQSVAAFFPLAFYGNASFFWVFFEPCDPLAFIENPLGL